MNQIILKCQLVKKFDPFQTKNGGVIQEAIVQTYKYMNGDPKTPADVVKIGTYGKASEQLSCLNIGDDILAIGKAITREVEKDGKIFYPTDVTIYEIYKAAPDYIF